jgi:hypothetical protein
VADSLKAHERKSKMQFMAKETAPDRHSLARTMELTEDKRAQALEAAMQTAFFTGEPLPLFVPRMP